MSETCDIDYSSLPGTYRYGCTALPCGTQSSTSYPPDTERWRPNLRGDVACFKTITPLPMICNASSHLSSLHGPTKAAVALFSSLSKQRHRIVKKPANPGWNATTDPANSLLYVDTDVHMLAQPRLLTSTSTQQSNGLISFVRVLSVVAHPRGG